MDKAIKMITGVLSTLTDLAIHLLVAGVVIGILYNDVFGVIGNIGAAMGTIGDNGLAGLITIAVVGGVSFFGGVGSIYGIVLGILVIGALKNAMIIMNMPHYTQNAVAGLFLIFAIGIDSYFQKNRGK